VCWYENRRAAIRKVLQKYTDRSFSTFAILFDPKDVIEMRHEKKPRWEYPAGAYDVIAGVEVQFEV
jgi:hypothetical protein